jgi:diguanylate cyclase (GGDEF)-like protein
MRNLSKRAMLGLVSICAFFAVLTITVGVVGVLAVRSTAADSGTIVSDQLTTTSATSRVSRAMDSAHLQGGELFEARDPAQAASEQRNLFDRTLPQVESALVVLEQLHASDSAAEHADLQEFADEWTAVRDLLTPTVSGGPSAARVRQLDAAYAPLSRHLDQLINQENIHAGISQRQAEATASKTTWTVLAAILLDLAAAVAIGVVGVRTIRRAIEPENEQIEFAEILQVTETEQDAHELLKRHLERAIPGSDATVLNRNNSADRLEAMTALAPGSCLTTTLRHAAPRSCLAIRSARPYLRNDDERPLLACTVCGDCPGSSSCTPLTVSGVVIGAVLVTRDSKRIRADDQRIRESVAQAAPVLANLRNLAMAEVLAATDSLTGLANKRAVNDTLKRMLAQASRTLTPLSLLMIDLDHFKQINDRLGHPVGDQALANVGSALKATMRESDFAGRNGGEEFAVLLPDTGLEGACATAEKIRAAIANIDLPGTGLALTASLGLAVYPDHAVTAERLERLADAALYTAKRGGRNRLEVAHHNDGDVASVGVEAPTT